MTFESSLVQKFSSAPVKYYPMLSFVSSVLLPFAHLLQPQPGADRVILTVRYTYNQSLDRRRQNKRNTPVMFNFPMKIATYLVSGKQYIYIF